MFCPNCGNQVNNGNFCPKCGTPLPSNRAADPTPPPAEPHVNYTYNYNYAEQPQPAAASYQAPPLPAEMLQTTSIAVAILLSIVTCGIYGLYWDYQIMKRIRFLYSGNFDCVGEFLLFLFVPFYSLYWVYTRSKQLADGMRRYGVAIDDLAVVNLLLMVFGVGIVSIALLQDQLNQFARANGGQ